MIDSLRHEEMVVQNDEQTTVPHTSSSHEDIPPLPRGALGNIPKVRDGLPTVHRFINLHAGTLYFTEEEAPKPPIHIGLDIEWLAAIWDDSWPTWKKISPLVIKERAVALKHFRSVYIGSSQWTSVRQQWSKWNVSGLHSIVSYPFDKTSFGQKFLMREYESSGAHKFWERWSVDGKRCTPSQILAGLAKKRKGAEKADADAARKEYVTNDDFQEVFSYRKGAQKFNMVSEKAIARRFRQLNKHPY